jgi:hypothetical protein
MNKVLEVCKTVKSEFEKHGIPTYLSTLHFVKNLPTDIVFIHCIFFTFFLLQVTENNMHGQEEFKKNVEEILGSLDIKSYRGELGYLSHVNTGYQNHLE